MCVVICIECRERGGEHKHWCAFLPEPEVCEGCGELLCSHPSEEPMAGESVYLGPVPQ